MVQRNRLVAFLMFIVGYFIFIIMNGNDPLIDQFSEKYLRQVVSVTPIFNTARFLTDFGSKQFLIPFVIFIMVVFCLQFRSVIPSVLFGAGTLITYYLHLFLKGIIQRPRPQIWEAASATGYSFPSGHAMISFVCYGLFIYFVVKKIKNVFWRKFFIIGFSVLILLIGLSRFVINVHYMSDVVGGYTFGYLLLTIFILIDQKIRTHTKRL